MRLSCGVFALLCALSSASALQAQDADTEPGFVEYAFSPSMVAKFSLGVLYDQATDQVPQWGSGADGLGKRAQWRMAGLLTRASVEYGVSRWRDTIPGYVRCRCKGFLPRSRHAVVSEFLDRRIDGGFAAPVARFSGIATSVALTSLGEHDTASGATEHALLLVSTDLGFNMLQEFWPEIRRTLLLRRR